MNILKSNTVDFPNLKFLEEYLEGHNGFIAGGCFKNIFNRETLKDIDIFFRNEEDFLKADTYFSKSPIYELVYVNRNAVSYLNTKTKTRIELIRNIFGSPKEVISQFDFTVVKIAFCKYLSNFSFEKLAVCGALSSDIIYSDQFFQDLVMKKLKIDDEIINPITTFERTLRYIKYGYTLDKESKQKLISSIRQTPEMADLSDENYFG